MNKKFLILATATLSMLLGITSIAYAVSTSSQPASDTAITIDNFSFSPATVTISAGTTVRWTNHDDIPHTIVSDDKTFKSKALDTDEQFSFTFTKPGTYSYFCGLHPKMTAKVVVQ
jgi:plastocyanin